MMAVYEPDDVRTPRRRRGVPWGVLVVIASALGWVALWRLAVWVAA